MMTPKSIASLKFVSRPVTSMFNRDPAAKRRSNFVMGLNKQLDVLSGKEDTEKVRAWFYPKGNGWIASVKYRNSAITLDGTNAFFEVSSKTALSTIYKSVLKEVSEGEWDSILEKKASGMKAGGRKKPLAQAA